MRLPIFITLSFALVSSVFGSPVLIGDTGIDSAMLPTAPTPGRAAGTLGPWDMGTVGTVGTVFGNPNVAPLPPDANAWWQNPNGDTPTTPPSPPPTAPPPSIVSKDPNPPVSAPPPVTDVPVPAPPPATNDNTPAGSSSAGYDKTGLIIGVVAMAVIVILIIVMGVRYSRRNSAKFTVPLGPKTRDSDSLNSEEIREDWKLPPIDEATAAAPAAESASAAQYYTSRSRSTRPSSDSSGDGPNPSVTSYQQDSESATTSMRAMMTASATATPNGSKSRSPEQSVTHSNYSNDRESQQRTRNYAQSQSSYDFSKVAPAGAAVPMIAAIARNSSKRTSMYHSESSSQESVELHDEYRMDQETAAVASDALDAAESPLSSKEEDWDEVQQMSPVAAAKPQSMTPSLSAATFNVKPVPLDTFLSKGSPEEQDVYDDEELVSPILSQMSLQDDDEELGLDSPMTARKLSLAGSQHREIYSTSAEDLAEAKLEQQGNEDDDEDEEDDRPLGQIGHRPMMRFPGPPDMSPPNVTEEPETSAELHLKSLMDNTEALSMKSEDDRRSSAASSAK